MKPLIMKSLTETLTRKAQISWGYLAIAIFLVLATFIKIDFTRSIYFLQYEHFQTGFRSGYTASSLNLTALTIWLFAVLYLVHFAYGAFFYPQKYKEVLEKKFVEDNNWETSSDYSAFRGIIGTAGICVITFSYIYSYNELSVNLTQGLIFWAVLSLWIILNALLAVKTATSSLFKRSSVIIDRNILAPWEKYAKNENIAHDYEQIFFDYPASNSKEEWKQKVAYAFAKELKEEHSKALTENEDAERLSRNIYDQLQQKT